jgi:hypothetical protein
VEALRAFRDRHLLTNRLGRAFVRFYERTSPPLAAWLRTHERARTAARWALTPLVLAVGYPGPAAVLSVAAIGLLAAWRLRRRDRARAALLPVLLAVLASSAGCSEDDGPATVDTIAPTTTATPAGGTYATIQLVTLAAGERATVYYALDGTALPAGFPTSGSGPNPHYWIRIGPGTTTLRFFSVDAAGNREATRTEVYVVGEGP